MIKLISLICFGVFVNAREKCRVTDEVCMVKAANDIYMRFFSESDELDPMHHDEIEGNLMNLKYTLQDVTVRGFKNCKVGVAKIDLGNLKFDSQLLCPGFTMNGKYNINGRLLLLPIEGNGDYVIEAKKYRIDIYMDIELQASEGKTYINVKRFKIKAEPLEGIEFKLENLFNGNKELAEPVLKYANENWKNIAKEFQSPILQTNIKQLIEVGNRCMKKIALDEYLIFE